MNLKTAMVVVVLSIPFLGGTVWAIVDAARREFRSLGEKALWVMVAAIPFVGFVVYLLLGFRRGTKPTASG